MKKITIAFTLLFLKSLVLSQSLKISNIHYRTIDNRIEVFYSLPKNKDSLFINFFFKKKSDLNFSYVPKYISGAVGKGLYSGINKKITWYFKKEPAWLFTGGGFYFKIIATKILTPKEENEL